MARGDIERTVQQSVLERLTDSEPGRPGDPPVTWAQSVRNYKQSVRRDIEWLLNTRRIKDPPPEALDETRHSLYEYGVPDITSLSRDSLDDRVELVREVEETIRLFEPRLDRVRVTLLETDSQDEKFRRELRFVIEGLLKMDPSPEHVVFDTVLEFSSGEFDVKGDASAR